MFMLIPSKVAICFRSTYFQGLLKVIYYTFTILCVEFSSFTVMQTLPQSSFRTFLSPQKESILTSSFRQVLICIPPTPVFEAWNNMHLLVSVLQVGNPGMKGLGSLLWVSQGWNQGVSFYLEALGKNFQLISVVDRVHFLAAVFCGPHSLAGCQLGLLSVLKRLLYSFSCGSFVFRQSQQQHTKSFGVLPWVSDFFFCHQP